MKTVLMFENLPMAKRAEFAARYDNLQFVYGDDPNWPDVLEHASAIVGFIPEPWRDQLKEIHFLELVQLPFAGYEGWEEKVSCPLANASGAFGLAISEYLIGTILYVYRHMEEIRRRQKQKVWNRNLGDIDSIYGKTILIAGCGDVGSTFAKKAQALGAYTIGAASRIRPIEGFDEVITIDQIDDRLPEADIFVGALPSNAATRHLITTQSFERMKPDALFINVGRGALVPLSVLEEAIEHKRVRAMILDVCEIEPLPQDSPLWDNENVLITPHLSGDCSLPETRRLLWELIEYNLDALNSEKPFRNIVNADRLPEAE